MYQGIRSSKTVVQYIDDTVEFDLISATDESEEYINASITPNSLAETLITHAVQIKELFNPLEEFADLFPDEIPGELPPMRVVNHRINLISGAT